ncbi:MAG TPA: 6-carboxytetrahydropterin synthase QueD [archaeon]|nr:6-carboxytetrahydropterin synthase QueD [archaeon]
MYRISVEDEFSSAHWLRDYEGKCSSIHGHNWKVRLTVRTGELDDKGMGMDFGFLKKFLAGVIRRFDHVNLNETEPFDWMNPTAENIARTIYELAEKELPAPFAVDRVELWESSRNRVEYTKE